MTRRVAAEGLLAAATLFGAGASTADPYDPAAYLREKSDEPVTDVTLTEGEVTRDGIRYRTFENSFGRILVPKLDGLRPEDFDAALCGDRIAPDLPKCIKGDDECLESREAKKQTHARQLAGAEIKLKPDVVAYARLIGTTIEQKCVGGRTVQEPRIYVLSPEVGIERRTEGRRPSSERVYYNPLSLSAGFGAEF